MNTIVAVLLLTGVAALVILSMFVGIYNGLVQLKKQVERSWSNIDIILKQRHDEIPQLIQIIQQFTQYEKSIIEKVITARTHYQNANNNEEKIKASNEITHAIQGVFAIGEAYPELKSNNQFTQLQTRLSSLEELLADRREFFNNMVTNYNTRIEQIPDMFFARVLGYQPLMLFKVEAEDKKMPSLEIFKAA